MDFKTPYLMAMRERAPKMFMELRRSGRLDDFLQARNQEASQLKRQLLAKYKHPSLQEEREAEEQVMSVMLEFPPMQENPPSLEPPDDLPTHPGA